MKLSVSYLFLSTLLSSTCAINLRKRQDSVSPRVVNLDLERNHIADPNAHDRARLKRGYNDVVEVKIINQKSMYSFEADLGTPSQRATFNLDTGSSDLWVNARASNYCKPPLNKCGDSGTYFANSSSTYRHVSSDFDISYVDGSGASGDYATDDLRFNDDAVGIKKFQFGIGYKSTSPINVLGIGYPEDEAYAEDSRREPYENLPSRLASEGITSSRAFSLYLNDMNATKGSILFGGVDHAKYEGDLITLPIELVDGKYKKFLITLTGVDFGSRTIRDDVALSVLLDSGTSLSYLPDDIAQEILDDLGLVADKETGAVKVPCTMHDDPRNVTFRFSAPSSITIPMSELVVSFQGDYHPRQKYGQQVEKECVFGIEPAQGRPVVFGDTFLRSAYVVFDLDNHEISIAQSKPSVSKTDIQEIGSGQGAVPETVVVDAPVAAKSGWASAGVGLSPLRRETVVLGCFSIVFGALESLV